MAEEILSPPYPSEGVTADGLFNHLKQLRKWVLHYRKSINAEIGQDVVPDVRAIPDKAAYLAQPVSILFNHLMFLRRVREGWDHLVREYEDAWDCGACTRQQALLVQTSALTINTAFIPFEQREVRAQREVERLHRTFEHLIEGLRRHMMPENFDGKKEKKDG